VSLPLPRIAARPEPPARSERAREIIAAGRAVLAAEGADALTMRRLGDEIGIRAASLYKHLPGKPALEAALVEAGMFAIGDVLHAALDAAGTGTDAGGDDEAGTPAEPTTQEPDTPVGALLATYRQVALANGNLYRLATSGRVDRSLLTPGLVDWSGEPFYRATGDPWVAQALFAAAHGAVILELDSAYSDMSDLDATWRALARAFALLAEPPPESRYPV
jgi:AcrR family transcriptional regulator